MGCIAWLSVNNNMTIPFKQFLHGIDINSKTMLDCLSDSPLSCLFDLCLLPQFKIIDDVPVRYNNNNMYYLDNDLKWNILSHSEFCECIKVFEQKLLYLLNEDKERLIQNDTYTDIMMKLVVVDNSVYTQLRKKVSDMVSFNYD
jgi:hypothetical protein